MGTRAVDAVGWTAINRRDDEFEERVRTACGLFAVKVCHNT